MNLICLSLVYEKLNFKDKENLNNVLKIIQIEYEKLKDVYNNSKQKYAGIEHPTIINKCNGTLIIAETQNIDKNLAYDLLKKLWIDCLDNEKKKEFQQLIYKINNFYGKEALIYLAETAVGIHSLVYGDIQVYSQVINGLSNDKYYENIAKLLNEIMLDIRKNTNISEGNVSLERVLADCVIKDGLNDIVLFGYGKSGKLIAKALSENNINITIYTRNETLTNEKNIKFKNYSELFFEENFNCIIALENNLSTVNIVKTICDKFINVYDISSPSILSELNNTNNYKKIVVLNDFIEIGKSNEVLRRKGNNAAKNIILKYITNFLSNITNQIVINYEINNLLSRKIIETRNLINLSLRKNMNNYKFLEVDIPSLLKFASENENTAFKMTFNNTVYYLTQSSQLLLQILVNSNISHVYNISHVFKNENIGINTMHEFQMFSCEFKNKNYNDVEILFDRILMYVLSDLKYQYNKLIKISYDEAFDIINSSLIEKIKYGSILDDNQLTILYNHINKKYNSKFYIINKYPINFRKFYHNLDEKNNVNMFKAYYENVCFASGGQRLTNKLEIEQNLYLSNNYIDKYSAYIDILNDKINHGGFSISVDALIKILLGLSTTNDCKIFKDIQL